MSPSSRSATRTLWPVTKSAYRYGDWRPLPEADDQALIVPTQMIAHSIVGSARSAYNYFRDGTSIESHWIFPKDGAAWQVMEATRRADANYLANRRHDGTGALSAETEDNGSPDTDPWTDPQLERLIDWFRWGHRTFGIPLRVCRTPDEPGIGFHTLHPYHWTNVRGKTCPGVVRKRQFYDIIVPTLAGRPTTDTPFDEEDDMAKWAFLIEAAYKEKFGDNLAGHPEGPKAAWGEISEWTVAVAAKPEGERHGGLNWIRQFELGLAGV